MVRVGINGFGTIGKRVADAVQAQPDMEVVGVVKASPDRGAALAADRGFSLFAPDKERLQAFRRRDAGALGTLPDLLESVDIIVDATPGGIGERNAKRYREADIPYILQGAEPPDAAKASFCARVNGPACLGSDSLRVVSCNTTGLGRTLALLDNIGPIRHVDATIVRRGGDPDQPDRGPINDIVPAPVGRSHHGADVQTLRSEWSIRTAAVTVPTTLMHVHSVNVTFETVPSRHSIREQLAAEPRVSLVPPQQDLDTISAIAEVGRDMGRPRGDVWEVGLWEDSLEVDGRRLSFMQAIHQESIVVPETIDAIRTLDGEDPLESAERTDEQLGIGNLLFEEPTSKTLLTAE